MFKKIVLVLLVVSAMLSLSSCARRQMSGYPPVSDDPAAIKLAEAASSVSQSLQDLSAIEQAANPQAAVKAPPNAGSYGMGQLSSIDWTGPLEPLVRRIASATGYKLQVIGKRPSQPVLLQIVAHDTPLGDVLQDAGFQAKNSANIVVFPTKKIIQIRYSGE